MAVHRVGHVGTPAEAMFPRQEAKANARLISAAPDLYEALLQAEAFISIALPHYAKDRNDAVEILPGIRAALAKASGKVFSTDENRRSETVR